MNTGQALADDISAVGNLAPRDDISTLAPYSDFPYLIEMEKLLPSGKTFQPPVGTDKIQQAVGDATEQILLNKMDGPQAADFFAQQATDLLGADAVESQ
jgi:ABC-type glycerol-3-phosphate transport system substrate-binding protein